MKKLFIISTLGLSVLFIIFAKQNSKSKSKLDYFELKSKHNRTHLAKLTKVDSG